MVITASCLCYSLYKSAQNVTQLSIPQNIVHTHSLMQHQHIQKFASLLHKQQLLHHKGAVVEQPSCLLSQGTKSQPSQHTHTIARPTTVLPHWKHCRQDIWIVQTHGRATGHAMAYRVTCCCHPSACTAIVMRARGNRPSSTWWLSWGVPSQLLVNTRSG